MYPQLLVLAPTLALCMVKRSTPVPTTLMLDTRDMKLKEIDTYKDRISLELMLRSLTGFLRQAKSVDLQRREILLQRLDWPGSLA